MKAIYWIGGIALALGVGYGIYKWTRPSVAVGKPDEPAPGEPEPLAALIKEGITFGGSIADYFG